MQSANENRDAYLETAVPFVRSLLGLGDALDEFQEGVLREVRHDYSRDAGRVQVLPPGRRPAALAGCRIYDFPRTYIRSGVEL